MKRIKHFSPALCWTCEARQALRLGASRPRLLPNLQRLHHRDVRRQARWQSTQQSPPRRPEFSIRRWGAFASLAFVASLYSYYGTTDSSLNGTTFVPYSITAREAISPTSFVLTISPKTPQENLPYLQPGSAAWLYSLWSVEFKQPEVQIARHYTPLPPWVGDDPRDGTLRFYVRAVDDGEMSNYLGRLRPGQNVSLRGPHRGFDVPGRLGVMKQVVVLAGGTGVVPGMQAAEAVLGSRKDAAVSLLWAVRKREELQDAAPSSQSSWWSGPQPTEMQTALASPSPVGRQLEQMKTKYGDRLTVQVAVDEEGSAFSQKSLASALQQGGNVKGSARGCRLHSQVLHKATSEFELQSPDCFCTAKGKNLLIVSGPDGFIDHYAGPKVWLGGMHTQGAVGGMIRDVQAQKPTLCDDWLVLKL